TLFHTSPLCHSRRISDSGRNMVVLQGKRVRKREIPYSNYVDLPPSSALKDDIWTEFVNSAIPWSIEGRTERLLTQHLYKCGWPFSNSFYTGSTDRLRCLQITRRMKDVLINIILYRPLYIQNVTEMSADISCGRVGNIHTTAATIFTTGSGAISNSN
ncbi:hypothetical protein L9F63_016548, partial [Diploptera punctata]